MQKRLMTIAAWACFLVSPPLALLAIWTSSVEFSGSAAVMLGCSIIFLMIAQADAL